MVWVSLFSEVDPALVIDCLAVHKIVIAQDSLGDLINVLRPGAYHSMTKIDFKALDHVRYLSDYQSYSPHSSQSR